MKHITARSIGSAMKLIAAFLTILIAGSVSANANSTLDKARKLREKSSVSVDSIKRNLSQLNTDSIAETVVFETAATETSAGTKGEQDDDSDWVMDDDSDTDFFGMNILPITAVVLGITVPFAALVLIVFLITRAFNARKRVKYDTIVKAAQAGHPLPPEFYRYDAPARKSKLQSGIVWIGWGVAFEILTLIGIGTCWCAIGVVPIFIGLARIITYYVENKRASDKDAEATGNDVDQA